MLFFTVDINVSNGPECVCCFNSPDECHVERVFRIIKPEGFLTCVVIFVTTFCISTTIVEWMRNFYLFNKFVWYLSLENTCCYFILWAFLIRNKLLVPMILKLSKKLLFILGHIIFKVLIIFLIVQTQIYILIVIFTMVFLNLLYLFSVDCLIFYRFESGILFGTH